MGVGMGMGGTGTCLRGVIGRLLLQLTRSESRGLKTLAQNLSTLVRTKIASHSALSVAH